MSEITLGATLGRIETGIAEIKGDLDKVIKQADANTRFRNQIIFLAKAVGWLLGTAVTAFTIKGCFL